MLACPLVDETDEEAISIAGYFIELKRRDFQKTLTKEEATTPDGKCHTRVLISRG